MSLDIWTLCAGNSKIRKLSFSGYRIIEDQYKNSTKKLVDTNEEQELLEVLIDKVKPPVSAECKNWHYLLYTPFRYPPLKYGSRFGSVSEKSLFYGSCNLKTVFTEAAYYQLCFLNAMQDDIRKQERRFCVFNVDIASNKGIDLTKSPFKKYKITLMDRHSYADSKLLGTSMRNDGVEVFLFYSARHQHNEGINFAIFNPKVFNFKTVKSKDMHTWYASVSKTSVEFYRNTAETDTYSFNKEYFAINGIFPDIPQ